MAFDVGVGIDAASALQRVHAPARESSFWFLMQIGIVLGLIAGYPVLEWLTRRHATVFLA
ncbi:MAG: DUF4396 domain-containing protein [Nocardioides sp.]|nr:DUF4396 domain-containing protein [Nocardioides sp.]